MRKTWSVPDLVVLALALTAVATTVQAQDAQDVYRRVSGNVAAVRVLGEGGELLTEVSALGLGSQSLVTRCDGIEGAPALQLTWQGKSVAAEVTHRDTARGLCLLRAPIGKVQALSVADSDPAIGSPVFAVAHVAGIGVTLSAGVLAAVRERDGETAIQFSAPIAPGASGGGLFDARGRLLGVIDYRYRDGQNVNFAVPARWIRDVETRAAAQKAMSETRDRVAQLARAARWQEVEPLARMLTTKAPRDRDAWYWLGTAQWGLKQLDAAAVSLDRAAKLGEVREDIVHNQVYVLAESKRLEPALDILQAAIAARQESPALWLLLGRVYAALGRADAAREAYQRVTEFDPWSAPAYQSLAQIAQAKGDLRGVVGAHRQLVRIDPTAWRNWLVLADDYLRAGETRRAAAAVARAETLSMENGGEGLGDVLYYKGRVAATEGRDSAAIAHYRKSLENKPWNAAEVWTDLGWQLFAVRLYKQAIEAHRQALKIQPDLLRAKQALIVVLKDYGREHEALAMLEALRREFPGDSFVWRQIGFANASLGNHEQAIVALREALKLDPKEAKVWAALAVQATLAGRKAEAMSAYQTLLGLDAAWADIAYREGVRWWEIRP